MLVRQNTTNGEVKGTVGKAIVLFFRLCNDSVLSHTRNNLLGGSYACTNAIVYYRFANKRPTKTSCYQFKVCDRHCTMVSMLKEL